MPDEFRGARFSLAHDADRHLHPTLPRGIGAFDAIHDSGRPETVPLCDLGRGGTLDGTVCATTFISATGVELSCSEAD